MTALIRTQHPASEPVSLSEAKAHLRLTHNDDALVNNLITAARMVCEEYTGRSTITQDWALWLDAFPDDAFLWWDGVREQASHRLSVRRSINIPRPPLQAITEVTLFAEDDSSSVFAPEHYFVDTQGEPGRLALRNHASWPTPQRAHHGIRISFTAGYGLADDVPAPLKQGMLAHVAQLYEHRGEGLSIKGDGLAVEALPAIVEALYRPFRMHRLFG